MLLFRSKSTTKNQIDRTKIQSSPVNRGLGPGTVRKTLILLSLGLFGITASAWLRFGTIQGVPAAIVLKFAMDQTARDAYFSGDLRLLHDRLNELGAEEEIKAFYRSRFQDEVELDQYIHQLMFDRTGYVGKAYKVGANQTLILKTLADRRFPQWFALAKQAGLVLSHRQEDGIIYLIFPDGASVPYEDFSEIYTSKMLRRLIRQQHRQQQPI